MSQRMPRAQTTSRRTGRDGKTNVLLFESLRTLEKTNGGVVQVYEIVCAEQSFGYLYVTSDRYSVVWQNTERFKFDMPYSLIEHQFSNKSQWRIRELRPIFPFRREKKDFSFHRATASVFFQGAETAEEFDMLDESAKTKYRFELLEQQPASISRIGFARYDSEIEFSGKAFEVCFTAENLSEQLSDNWEYVINLPRHIVLKAFSLRWLVENHKLRELDQGIDYRTSVAVLSDLLSQEPLLV